MSRSRAKAIWQEAYDEHTWRQNDAIRATMAEGPIAGRPTEEVFAKLEERLTRHVPSKEPEEPKEPEWTDAQWDALFHEMEAKRYRETRASMAADLPDARAFDTAALSLATTPTCIFALYTAARHSATVEEFLVVTQEMARVCKYDL